MAITNAQQVGQFVARLNLDSIPAEVLAEAKRCLVDWCGVAIGGHAEPGSQCVRTLAAGFGSQGGAMVLLGEPMSAPLAALVNGAAAHALDFDDTHAASVAHISSPTMAAVLALGTERKVSESDLLRAFIAGFEVGARLGGEQFGVRVNERGWHSTGIFGTLSAGAAASVLLGLSEEGVVRALGVAASMASGLMESAGTMSKPLHAGKAAMSGIMAAQLAQGEFQPSVSLLEPGKGLGRALVQDGVQTLPAFKSDGPWELTRNTFKPYSCCLLCHASIDAARDLRTQVQGRPIARITSRVNPLTLQLAAKPAPRNGLEGKFSTQYGIALALSGYDAGERDYADDRAGDAALQSLVQRTDLIPDAAMTISAADMEIKLEDGTVLRAGTQLARGNPGNPMSNDDHWRKFRSLVEPHLGASAEQLFDVLMNFERPGSRDAMVHLLGRAAPGGLAQKRA